MITYENRMRVYCWRRKNRVHPETGKAPVSIRIEIDGFPRAELLTRVLTTEKEWSQPAQRKVVQRGMSREDQQLLDLDNQTLAKFILSIHQGYNNQKSQGHNPSPKELLELLRGGKTKDHDDSQLLRVCQLFYADKERPDRRGQQYAPGTLKNFRNAIGVLTRYLAHLRRPKLRVSEVDQAWAEAFDSWMEPQFTHGSAAQMLSILGRIMKFAVKKKLLKTNEYAGYEQMGVAPAPAQRHLTATELAAFEAWPCQTPVQTKAQHIWIFSAYTGLSFIDYARFAKEPERYLKTVEVDPKQPAKGTVLVLEIDRQKMKSKHGKANWIPLLPEEPPYRYLFSIYKQGLPLLSPGYVGKLLKEIAAQIMAAGIPFGLPDLTHKDARSTCSKMTLDQFGREAAAAKLNHSVAMSAKAYSTEDKRVTLNLLNVLGGELSHN